LKYHSSALIVFIFLSFTVFAGCQEKKQEPQDSLRLRPGVEIKNTDDGEVRIQYYDKGQTRSETLYKNGKRNGYHRLYNEDDILLSEGTFTDGKMEGEFKSFYPDGSIKILAHYKHGLLDGESLTYNLNGQVIIKDIYKKNKIIKTIRYKPNGEIEYEETFE